MSWKQIHQGVSKATNVTADIECSLNGTVVWFHIRVPDEHANKNVRVTVEVEEPKYRAERDHDGNWDVKDADDVLRATFWNDDGRNPRAESEAKAEAARLNALPELRAAE